MHASACAGKINGSDVICTFDPAAHVAGTFRFTNGDVYEGEWKDGAKDGHGTCDGSGAM